MMKRNKQKKQATEQSQTDEENFVQIQQDEATSEAKRAASSSNDSGTWNLVSGAADHAEPQGQIEDPPEIDLSLKKDVTIDGLD